MSVYSVSYDLHKPKQDYADLIAELKKSRRWWHYLASTWLIETDESAEELWDRISPYLDEDDRALIIRVCDESRGWLPEKAWDWINTYVPYC